MSGPRRAPAPPLRLRLRSEAAARRAISYDTKTRKPDGGWGHTKRPRRGQCKRPERASEPRTSDPQSDRLEVRQLAPSRDGLGPVGLCRPTSWFQEFRREWYPCESRATGRLRGCRALSRPILATTRPPSPG